MSVLKKKITRAMPDWLVKIRAYQKKSGRIPNIISPATFTEKVMHRMLFDRRPILTQIADKMGARVYVESRLGAQILPKLYYVTSNPASIPFDQLPDQFVVKPTVGNGGVEIVTEKASLDRGGLILTCQNWLRANSDEVRREAPTHLEPSILIEELITDPSGGMPSEYKLYVFDGTVRLIQVDLGRGDSKRRRLYSPNWKRLNVRHVYSDVPGPLPRPPHLDDMIAAAERLGHGMEFVRADFFDTAEGFYFGELNATPGSGLELFQPPEFDHYLGSMWQLPRSVLLTRLLQICGL
ncbi:MAG: hypothetical protein M3N08_08980 [Pseudomonadota bacterium]|nr:hypothetical protein [Pseudomonadota bacterium]